MNTSPYGRKCDELIQLIAAAIAQMPVLHYAMRQLRVTEDNGRGGYSKYSLLIGDRTCWCLTVRDGRGTTLLDIAYVNGYARVNGVKYTSGPMGSCIEYIDKTPNYFIVAMVNRLLA